MRHKVLFYNNNYAVVLDVSWFQWNFLNEATCVQNQSLCSWNVKDNKFQYDGVKVQPLFELLWIFLLCIQSSGYATEE